MSNTIPCPICGPVFEGEAQMQPTSRDGYAYACNVCGDYELSRHAQVTYFDNRTAQVEPIQAALISHRIRQNHDAGQHSFLTLEAVENILQDELPTPPQQATNLIAFVGDIERRTGRPARLKTSLPSIIGAASFGQAAIVGEELNSRNLLNFKRLPTSTSDSARYYARLTFDGWKQYEEEKMGRSSGNYGFLAMQFEAPELERFVKDVLKPLVREKLDYDLRDLRDRQEAGIIDVVMRNRIRDSAFVIVDLTHDNRGAYWEAGYAEGLGKPVIYICEQAKFEKAQTHFDTNHNHTVMWETTGDNSKFQEKLVETIKATMNLLS
ncbi:MAG: hypothetical protein ACPG1C_09465 [Alphaproteobacteria bacterium]